MANRKTWHLNKVVIIIIVITSCCIRQVECCSHIVYLTLIAHEKDCKKLTKCVYLSLTSIKGRFINKSKGRVSETYLIKCSFSCTAGHYTEGSETAKIRHWKKLKWKLACTTGSPTPSRLGSLLAWRLAAIIIIKMKSIKEAEKFTKEKHEERSWYCTLRAVHVTMWSLNSYWMSTGWDSWSSFANLLRIWDKRYIVNRILVIKLWSNFQPYSILFFSSCLFLMTLSVTTKNRNLNMLQPCLTSILILNHYPNSPWYSLLTVLVK